MFLKLDGVDGESQDAAHKDEIEVLDWTWSMVQSGAMHSGSGGGAGKAQVGDLEFSHHLDRASPNLMRMCLPGIALRSLSMVPRQIPYRSEQVHFQLEPEGALWQQLLASGGIGIHLAVEFPGLVLQLWGLR